MKKFIRLCSACVFLFVFGKSSAQQLLIKNVQVINVEQQKILPGQQVFINNGWIEKVEKVNKKMPPVGTQIIEGNNRYIAPGFIDGHVHFFQSGSLFTRPDALDLRKYQPYDKEITWVKSHMGEFLNRYLAVGITGVIDVGATYNFLQLRDSFINNTGAPSIYMTGPLITTWEPDVFRNLAKDEPFQEMKTVEDAQRLVKAQLPFKPDFIKVWYIVTDKDKEAGARKKLPLVKAVIDEAHANHLKVAIHATERITAQLAVEAGADFLVHNVDDEIIKPDFIQLLKSHQTVLCPTLIVASNYMKVFEDAYTFSTQELNLVHPHPAATIIDYPWPDTIMGNQYIKYMRKTGIANQLQSDSIANVNLKLLADAGVYIVTGTDAGNIGTQHATSYRNELLAMQQAGLSMWQLLQASTINGARAMGKEATEGSIAKGKKAQFILFNKNPLDSLANWSAIDLVYNKGVFIAPDTIVQLSATDLVQQQLNGYNAHNLEAFLAPYADDVEIYKFPNTLTVKGKDKMRKMYGFIERMPNLYCKLQNRIVNGNIVIDHEEIWGVDKKPFYGIAIYEIEKGKISKVYFPE